MDKVMTGTIQLLRAEAAQHGDTKMVAICDRALNGSKRALAEVRNVLRAVAAMRD